VTTTLDWYGCSTFRLQTMGITVFLDAYVDRAPGADGTGLTADDIAECDWIVVGHSHFDHLWGAERIMANTDARLISSYESVRILEQAGVPVDRMICVSGGERVELGAGVSVSAFPSLHSSLWTGSHGTGAGEVCIGEPRRGLARTGCPDEGARRSAGRHPRPLGHRAPINAASGHSDRGDGGALLYLFETPEGSLLFQDTSGHWGGILRTLTPDVAILAAAGRATVDGEPVQGSLADFVVGEARDLRTRRVVLGHHDNWLPGFAAAIDVEPVRAAFEARAPEVELVEPTYLAATPIFEGLRD
jgi:L-ascorbate metabolism protein UlaG (beta-lactamase superfamily)